MYPEDLYYSKEHEWIRVGGDVCTIGITHHAQEALGDIVFVELPEVGAIVDAEEAVGSIESVKAVSDLFSPVSGEILEVNEALEDTPETVNAEPYEGGWIFKMSLADSSELGNLLDAESYQKYLEESES
jgi:glycine cleavage system H protein